MRKSLACVYRVGGEHASQKGGGLEVRGRGVNEGDGSRPVSHHLMASS